MKLCPQCEFIYEDEQSFCDMDGTGLVHNPASELTVSRLTIPLVVDSNSTRRRSSNPGLAILVVIVLAGLVVAFVARARQARARLSSEPTQSSLLATDQPAQANAQATSVQSSLASDVDQTSPSQSSEQLIASTSSASDQPDVGPNSLEKTSLAHSRLNTSPVSAGSSTASNRGPVIIRLTNGSVIRADEAWDKGEGVWYRQAGMVTFIKRSRVRAIERVAVLTPSQPMARNAAATKSSNQSAMKSGSRDQLRIAKLEPVKPKKESRVTSFLKKTGNWIKKPFRL